MDTPRGLTWQELCTLAQDRDGWRQRVRNLRYGAKAGAKISIIWNPKLPGCKATSLHHDDHDAANLDPPRTPISPSKLTARRYRHRDEHQIFFRGGGGKRKLKRKRKASNKPFEKRPNLTDKQRAPAARAYYDTNFGTGSTKNTTSTPLTPWSPRILGHHHHNTDDLNSTIPITPPAFNEMWDYAADPGTNRNMKIFPDHTMLENTT